MTGLSGELCWALRAVSKLRTCSIPECRALLSNASSSPVVLPFQHHRTVTLACFSGWPDCHMRKPLAAEQVSCAGCRGVLWRLSVEKPASHRHSQIISLVSHQSRGCHWLSSDCLILTS